MTTSKAHYLLEKIGPRAGPLIITVFGDTIAPRGGSIWLGSLIEMMAPLGLSERLVRTGVYRLAREGWLIARQEGRRSLYTITPEGLDTFAEADARIYATSPLPWNGKWTMVLALPDADSKSRKEIRNLLTWRGFGQLSPTMMIKPGSDTTNVNHVLKTASLTSCCIVFTAELDAQSDKKTIVSNGWDLSSLTGAYNSLLQCFADDTHQAVTTTTDAFVLRTLLIHQYRRILLKDPQLPGQLLPSDWNGEKAAKLVAETYKALSPRADSFVAKTMQSDNDTCPQPSPSYHKRFLTA